MVFNHHHGLRGFYDACSELATKPQSNDRKTGFLAINFLAESKMKLTKAPEGIERRDAEPRQPP